MCRAPPWRMLLLVTTRIVHIAIEAHVGEDEIGGQIQSDVGPPALFSGWLSLISALDSLLSGSVGPTAAPGALPSGGDAPGTTSERPDK
jgi:hypothetical protein